MKKFIKQICCGSLETDSPGSRVRAGNSAPWTTGNKNIRVMKNVLTEGVVKHWNRILRGSGRTVIPRSVQKTTRYDTVPYSLVAMVLFAQKLDLILEVFSNLHDSMGKLYQRAGFQRVRLFRCIFMWLLSQKVRWSLRSQLVVLCLCSHHPI